jgi:hypothetical protein
VIHTITGLHYRTGIHDNVTEQVGSSGDVYDLHMVHSQAESLPGQELL